MANKVEVFNKIKEVHQRMNTASPQVLLSVLTRELNVSATEIDRHLEGLAQMDLVKFKGTAKRAVELTRNGLTTNMKMARPQVVPEIVPERV